MSYLYLKTRTNQFYDCCGNSNSLRTFDVEGGEHPVQMLVDDLTPQLYIPIQEWLEHLMPDIPDPREFKIPAPCHSFRYWAQKPEKIQVLTH